MTESDSILGGVEEMGSAAYNLGGDLLDAGIHTAEGVGDGALTEGQSFEAAGDAFIGDMSGAAVHNADANASAAAAESQFDNAGQDLDNAYTDVVGE